MRADRSCAGSTGSTGSTARLAADAPADHYFW
jgi:hypothetical protein